MQITQSQVKDLQTVLTLVVEPADYEELTEKELRQMRQKVNMPGFRPGMVPFGLVKKMYRKAVLADVINKFLGEQLGKYIEENHLNTLGEPLPNEELSQKVDFDNDTTFTFAFDVALAPEMNVVPTDKDTLTQYVVTVTEEMVNNQVNAYRNRYGSVEEGEKVEADDVIKGVLTEQTENGIVKENATLNPRYMKDDAQRQLFLNAKKGDNITFNPVKAYDSEVEVASMLDIKKEEVANHTGDFVFEIQNIMHHVDANLDAELFAKVYGENNVKDEADFRARVKAEIEENMKMDTDYKFGLDVKAVIMNKIKDVAFPETFLRRWVKTTNEKMTDETLDRDFPQMVDELKWHLAKDQLLKHYELKVEKEDVEAYAKQVAKMQFMQYGLMHVDDQYLTSFAERMLKDEDQLRGIVERVSENKIYEAVKKSAKVKTKEVTSEEFNKLFE